MPTLTLPAFGIDPTPMTLTRMLGKSRRWRKGCCCHYNPIVVCRGIFDGPNQRPLPVPRDRVRLRGRAEVGDALPLCELPACRVRTGGDLHWCTPGAVSLPQGRTRALCLLAWRRAPLLRPLRLAAGLHRRELAGRDPSVARHARGSRAMATLRPCLCWRAAPLVRNQRSSATIPDHRRQGRQADRARARLIEATWVAALSRHGPLPLAGACAGAAAIRSGARPIELANGLPPDARRTPGNALRTSVDRAWRASLRAI